jgi:hypothetical protein
MASLSAAGQMAPSPHLKPCSARLQLTVDLKNATSAFADAASMLLSHQVATMPKQKYLELRAKTAEAAKAAESARNALLKHRAECDC